MDGGIHRLVAGF